MRPDYRSDRHHRELFSTDVGNYELGRPGYPSDVFARLRDACGLGPGTRVLEIGPGTGQATGPLLDAGAVVTAIELGPEMVARLREKFAGRPLRVRRGAFEDEVVEEGCFDLVTAATSFHWVPAAAGLRTCGAALRAGGWLALWWTVFGDDERPDPFHEALAPILARRAPELLRPSGESTTGVEVHPHALDVATRCAEIDETGMFGPVRHETFSWTGGHSPEEIRAMFATFSSWMAIDPDLLRPLLDELETLARDTFDGVVERPYVTSLYVAQRLTG